MTTHQPSGPLAPVDPQPILGLHGEPCASCGAPLAADQRYCLDCGARRADARLPFRDILASAPASHPAYGPVGAPPPATAAHADGHRGTVAALAGLGVVLIALAAGVLIGQAGDGDSKQSSTPQVINLGGAAATPGAAAAGSKASGSSSQGGSSKSKSSSGGSSSGSKAANPSIKKLEKLSPQQYQKQSQKLPKVVGTGGKPPPKDNKPAAGGGDFQTIG